MWKPHGGGDCEYRTICTYVSYWVFSVLGHVIHPEQNEAKMTTETLPQILTDLAVRVHDRYSREEWTYYHPQRAVLLEGGAWFDPLNDNDDSRIIRDKLKDAGFGISSVDDEIYAVAIFRGDTSLSYVHSQKLPKCFDGFDIPRSVLCYAAWLAFKRLE